MIIRFTLCFALTTAFFALQPNSYWAQTSSSFAPTARVDPSLLKGLISEPSIWSYDLSSDGNTIALLVESGPTWKGPLWLVTWDVVQKRVIGSRQLGHSVFPMGESHQQVFYASSQRYLIVQDSQTIRVFDSKSLEQIRTISPPSGKESQIPIFMTGASNKDIFVCAFGPNQKRIYTFHTTSVQVEIVDISSGTRLGEWASEDLPQSISPNGDLIAVSSTRAQQGVLPLNVFDVHGQKVAEFTGGFSLVKIDDPSKPMGRVMGFFVSNQELLLCPDGNFDKTGHVSGDSMRLVSVTGKQVQQIIKWRNFGPGQMAISADRRTIVVTNSYIPARYLAHPHWALPNLPAPEAMVFGWDTSLHLETAFPIHESGINGGTWLGTWLPRLSSDGSILAIGQDVGVTILKKNASQSQHP